MTKDDLKLPAKPRPAWLPDPEDLKQAAVPAPKLPASAYRLLTMGEARKLSTGDLCYVMDSSMEIWPARFRGARDTQITVQYMKGESKREIHIERVDAHLEPLPDFFPCVDATVTYTLVAPKEPAQEPDALSKEERACLQILYLCNVSLVTPQDEAYPFYEALVCKGLAVQSRLHNFAITQEGRSVHERVN